VSLQASAMQSTLLDSLPSTLGENVTVDALDTAVCTLLHDRRCRIHSGHSSTDLERGKIIAVSWNMIFVWQFPIMTMTYAWVMFVLALSVYVCTPLINHDPWGPQTKVRSRLNLSSCVGSPFQDSSVLYRHSWMHVLGFRLVLAITSPYPDNYYRGY
jgi:hypothetical protein